MLWPCAAAVTSPTKILSLAAYMRGAPGLRKESRDVAGAAQAVQPLGGCVAAGGKCVADVRLVAACRRGA